MTDSTSLKVFKCPSCGAPLDPEKGASTMKCPYCGASIVIPESIRTPASSSTSLSDVTRLAKEGKLDEAAKIYSKITGLSHENAMFSVKSMAGVRDEEPASDPYRSFNQPQARPSYQAPPQPQPVYAQPTVRVRGGSCLSGIIRLVILISILATALPAVWQALRFELPFELPFLSGENPIIPAPFAKEVMSFKPNSLQDPRAIGLDGSGNILVFNYNSSQVQIFDPAGNQISEIAITESNGNKLYADNMLVSQDGTLYIPGFNGILVFNENGERLREFSNDEDLFIIHSITMGPNDTLYAISSSGIVRLDENGATDLKITEDIIKEVSGESPGIGAMGVDAQGNIYFSGDFVTDILKFSPNGEFISKFGGDFTSIRQIAFDNYGRIYVVDFFEVKVYDSNFNYINRIEGAFWA